MGERTDRVTLVGPFLHGWVYRTASAAVYYKLLPIHQATVEWRHAVRGWVNADPATWPADLIQPSRAEQAQDPLDQCAPYFAIRYELPRPAETLADRLGGEDTCDRLQCVVRILRALPKWWTRPGAPVLAMPSDVLLAADGTPVLLAMPFLRMPDAEAVFAEPIRAFSLAPELLGIGSRGKWTAEHWQNVDRYAAGALLRYGLYALSAASDPGMFLARVGNGTAFANGRHPMRLPFWMQRLEAAQQALEVCARLTAGDPARRAEQNLERLAEQLDHCRQRLSPREAVLEMRRFREPALALKLLQEILLTDESYDLLVLAGETARHAARPLEAVDFYERAIRCEPQRSEAYEGQFDLLAHSFHHAPLTDLYQGQGTAALQLDAKVWRDFQALPADKQQRLEESMAGYLVWRSRFELWRGELDAVAAFIHRRLFDESNTFLWWKLGLNLAYGEVLFLQARVLATQLPDPAAAQKRLAEAQSQLDIVRKALRRLREGQFIGPGEVAQYGEVLQALTVGCHEFQQELHQTRPPGP